MSTPSNLYAEKVFAEHPNALWALDDTCNFVSILSDEILTDSGWTVSKSNASLSVTTSLDTVKTNPVEDAPDVYEVFISNAPTAGTTYTVSLTKSFTITDLDSFNVSFYAYIDNPYIDSITVYCLNSSDAVLDSQSFTPTEIIWTPISKTFFETGSLKIKIEFSLVIPAGPTLPVPNEYSVFINGFSLGYRSEEFASESIGVQLEAIDASLNFSGHGVKANQYGTSDNYGYYVGNNTSKILYAKNSSMPLVYGASNSTILYENPDGPSLIVPGFGFLNEVGKHQTLVFETWLRIRSISTSVAKKIIGQISTNDGLYVYGPYLILKIGSSTISHYVGEWFRPMLIQIELNAGFATLLLNGEIVGNVEYSTDSFADKFTGELDNDLIGFYAYSDIPTVEVDCISIYSYKISPTVALRRFGYGQAVKLPENLTTAYGGIQVVPDYEKAGYKNVKKYPEWTVSYKDNISIDTKPLKTPTFDFPTVILNNTFGESDTDLSVWKSDLLAANISAVSNDDGFITIRPNNNWKDVHGYLTVESLSMFGTADSIKTIYGVFEKSADYPDEQILFKLENPNNGDHIFASILNRDIYYRYKIGATSGTLVKINDITANSLRFAVGFDIDTLKDTDLPIDELFENVDSLQLFIGGDYAGIDKEVSTTFNGKIIQFGISTQNPSDEILAYFAASGTIESVESNISNFINHKASYKINNKPITIADEKLYLLDISSKSFVTDYIPLKSFAQTVVKDGVATYDLDFIQFNIDYPEVPVVMGNFNTENSLVKTYIAFDYINSKLPLYSSDITNTVTLSQLNVVDAGSSWQNKKYEVVDGTIIYIPTEDFAPGRSIQDLKIIVYLEIVCPAVSSLPISIRSMRLSPVSLNSNSKNLIGTKYTKSIYPLSETQSYDGYAPYAINDSNVSYLYLTNKTGIKLLDTDTTLNFKIDETESNQVFLSSINMICMFNNGYVPEQKAVVISIGDSLRVTMQRLDGDYGSITDKAKLSLEKKNNLGVYVETTDVKFYINGVYCNNPVVSLKEWTSLGVLFLISEDIGSDAVFSITSEILVNDISCYKLDQDKISEQYVYRTWFSTKYEGAGMSVTNDWNEILTNTTDWGIWSKVLYEIEKVQVNIDPKLIHSIYTGTNKIFATIYDDISGLRSHDYQYSEYSKGTWQQFVLPAV